MRLLTITVLLLILTLNASAARVDTNAGTHALLFDLKGLSNLGVGTFDGGFGWRWFVKNDLALRTQVDYTNLVREVGASVQHGESYTGARSTTDDFGLTFLLEKRLQNRGPLSTYVGAGCGYGMRDVTSQNPVPVDTEPGTPIEMRTKDTSWSLLGALGFEYAFLDHLAFGGEYRLNYQHLSEESQRLYYDEPVEEMPDSTRRSLGVSTGALYLSVGF